MPQEVVATIHDLSDGEMKQVAVGDTDVLLARVDGAYHAAYAYCTHYGGPLAKGALSGDRVVCPWHHACFRVGTGDQLEPPGLDSLPTFDVEIEGEDVVVHVPDEFDAMRTREMVRRDEDDDRTFVVLGAGAAGAYAVEALRTAGYGGRLVLITQEDVQPYDRPNCSKAYLAGEAPEEWMFLRSKGFYVEHDIELMEKRRVTEVDVEQKTITFEEGTSMPFDGLILGTGGRARALPVPGADLKNVATLRSYQDSKTLRTLAETTDNAVVVGASFIGMEVAQALRQHDVEVTVVAPEAVPFLRVLGERIGSMVQAMHEENGVQFRLGHTVQRFEGNGDVEDAVRRVVLDDGDVLQADLVVVGIGVEPVTDYLMGANLADDGSVVVDEYLRVADGVYAAGDIARFPDWRTGEATRIEHWRLACQHGRLAGYNLAGQAHPYRSVPFFWTRHFGTSIQYVGHTDGWDEIIFDGDPADRTFIAYYVKDGAVRAAAGVGRGKAMAAIEELMRRERMPSPEELRAGAVDLAARLR